MTIGLLFVAVVLTACLMPAQSDTYWHLRAGADIWRTHHVPLVETYSHTARGQFWPNHEWLWQAFSYAMVRTGGMPLLAAAAAGIVAGAFALAYRLMVSAPATRFALMVAGVPISACVWALRPQIVSLALLALLVTLLARERYRWLPLLFVAWANVHGAVALGGAVLAVTAAAALVRARSGDPHDQRRALTLTLLTPLCAAATALTPLGPRLWTFIGESIQRSRRTMINEWMPAYPNGPVEIAFWVLAIGFVVLLVLRWRRLRAWSDVAVVIAAVVVLPLAMRAVRNIPPFLLLAMPAASRLLGADFRLGRRAADARTTEEHPRLNLAILVALALGGAAVVGVAWAAPLPRLGWRPLPDGAIAALRACPGPLYNRYNDGGFVIWFVPETPVFIDSRQDPYPVDFVLDTVRDDSHATAMTTLARRGIRCVLLPHDSETLPQLASAGWRTRYSDADWSVVYAPLTPATAAGTARDPAGTPAPR
ncbi:MAG TPA: hypothetical protein VG818_13685 [Gemmatimonadaceae bacterium]|nr:hypothetical protein [Gemmatimonadaceae bacterium]